MGERHAELPRRAAGLGRVVGIGDDERGGCLVEGFGRVGLFHRIVAGVQRDIYAESKGLAAEKAKDARLMPRSRPASGL